MTMTVVLIWILSASSLTANALEIFRNQHIFDATFVSQGRPVEACLDECADSTGCMGFDFNQEQETCWLHTRNTICGEKYSKDACVHYGLVDCPLTSLNDSPLQRTQNVHIRGGRLHDQITTIGGCLNLCASVVDCDGFDFDSRDRSCWIHSASTECEELRPKEGCTHYRFRECTQVAETSPPPRRRSTTVSANNAQPQLNAFRSFRDQSIANGRPLPYIDTKGDCFDICWTNERCTGFDWNQRLLRCRIHDAETECDAMRPDPNTSHYRLRTECPPSRPQPQAPTPSPVDPIPPPGECEEFEFETMFGARQPGGRQVAEGVTREQCELLCSLTESCQAVNWVITERTCFILDVSGQAVADNCCVHIARVCMSNNGGDAGVIGGTGGRVPQGVAGGVNAIPRRSTTEDPSRTTTTTTTSTTTTTTTTTPAPQPPIEMVRADGACPESNLFEYPLSLLFGNSIPLPGVEDVEGCKQACLDNAVCQGVDFNHQFPVRGLSCFAHLQSIEPENRLLSNQPCCSHFRKTMCDPKQCLTHQPVELSLVSQINPLQAFDTLDVRPGGMFTPQFVTCNGYCVTETSFSFTENGVTIDFSSPLTVSRRCAPAGSRLEGISGRGGMECAVRYTPGTQDTTHTCACTGHRCNYFGIFLFPDIVAYFPFDRTVEDLSPARRPAEGLNIKYDAADTMKNVSARFEGNAYVDVPTFANVDFTNQRRLANNQPTFTVAVWIKRDGVEGRSVIVSNERPEEASLEVTSVIDATATHRIHATIRLDGVRHTVNTTAPINRWFFLVVMLQSSLPAVRIGVQPTANNLYLVIHIDNVNVVEAFTDLQIPIGSSDARLDISSQSLCIGKQVTVPEVGGVPQPQDFFRGFMDELWIFSRSFAPTNLEVIKGASEFPGRLFYS